MQVSRGHPCRLRLTAALLLGLTVLVQAVLVQTALALPAQAAESAMAKASDCAGCHAQQVSDWQQSHHAKAMQRATPATVLGRFDGSAVRYRDSEFRFRRDGEHYRVRVREGDAEPAEFNVAYAFGVYPLQQYLAELDGGRLQALPVAWDSRSEAEGGQRWYALESDLPWRHVGFNWNSSCAECHSTGLVKNYDADQRRFDTRWQAINVSCQACHGDADGHRRWLAGGRPEGVAHAGFAAALDERGRWQRSAQQAIASRSDRPVGEQLSTCGQCHARRGKLGDWHPGTALLDHALPATSLPPLYHGDGQIRDEVFVLGSFMQSKMHAAGVVCSDCHQPHSLALRAEGDALCARCHNPAVFAGRQHHGHAEGSAQCVDCHMPATTYMGVDARRDHRFGLPAPALSAELGSPDACGSCHVDRSSDWLAEAIGRVSGGKAAPVTASRAMARLGQGDRAALPQLRYLLEQDQAAPMLQAAMLELLGAQAEPADLAIARGKLAHADALVRLGAVRAISAVPEAQRWALLSPMLSDPVRAVRVETARLLSHLRVPSVEENKRGPLAAAQGEYLAFLQAHRDSPAATLNLGNFYRAQGQPERAQTYYRESLALDREFVPAYLQLAELARQQQQPEQEQQWLAQVLAAAPDSAQAHYADGLYWVRRQNYERALQALSRARELAPAAVDYNTTLAVALENRGQPERALDILGAFIRQQPRQLPAVRLAARYALKYRQRELATRYLQLWLQLEPGNEQARQWLRALGN